MIGHPRREGVVEGRTGAVHLPLRRPLADQPIEIPCLELVCIRRQHLQVADAVVARAGPEGVVERERGQRGVATGAAAADREALVRARRSSRSKIASERHAHVDFFERVNPRIGWVGAVRIGVGVARRVVRAAPAACGQRQGDDRDCDGVLQEHDAVFSSGISSFRSLYAVGSLGHLLQRKRPAVVAGFAAGRAPGVIGRRALQVSDGDQGSSSSAMPFRSSATAWSCRSISSKAVSATSSLSRSIA